MKFLSMFFFVFTIVVFADPPRFTGPTYILDSGVPIDVGSYGSPCVYDWSGDGKKDIIIGQFDSGYVRFYRNIGTDINPEFNGFQYLYASGSPITLPYG